MTIDLKAIHRAADDVIPGHFDDCIKKMAGYFSVVTPEVVAKLAFHAQELEDRAKRAEDMLNSIYSSISAPNSVLVWRGTGAIDMFKNSDELKRAVPANCMGVVLTDGVTLDVLGEHEMRRHGWMRILAAPDDAEGAG